ncbi:MAG: glycosyltransferase family 2 protein [Magnetococcales bacterium]|nr:glycosyltransferase family 2 protein [Magnetococcales bacterium]
MNDRVPAKPNTIPAVRTQTRLEPDPAPAVSVVIPFFNEEKNVALLLDKVRRVMEGLGGSFEIVCVNDGSTDGTEGILDAIAAEHSRIRLVHFRRNHGQTAAMMAGFEFSRGAVVVTLDGDLQNDPTDIPRLLEKLEEGYSLVSGWRKDRKDDALRRNLPSRVANRLISSISGIHLHDYGCTLKAYRRDMIRGMHLYGEMHRFAPIYASWQGGRVAEIPVAHHPRIHGVSKYGLNRIFKVLLDLMVVKFLGDYQTKPIYVFGMFGFLCFLLAGGAGVYALYLKFAQGISLIQTPLPLLAVFCAVCGVLSILIGLIGELLVRIYYEVQSKPIYHVLRTVNMDEGV